MTESMPDADTLYRALLARTPVWEGQVWVGVTSTGVFCRLTCPARKPKRANVRFFGAINAAMEAGFRPCRRCRPLEPGDRQPAFMAALLGRLDAAPERRWTEADLAAAGLDPSAVRRAFRRRYGTTFLAMARARRIGLAARSLRHGASVIDAQLDAGYASGSGFRRAFSNHEGTAPAAMRGTAGKGETA